MGHAEFHLIKTNNHNKEDDESELYYMFKAEGEFITHFPILVKYGCLLDLVLFNPF